MRPRPSALLAPRSGKNDGCQQRKQGHACRHGPVCVNRKEFNPCPGPYSCSDTAAAIMQDQKYRRKKAMLESMASCWI